jgi:hypothetical protein
MTIFQTQCKKGVGAEAPTRKSYETDQIASDGLSTLLKISVQQTLQCLAVASLITGHLVDGLSVLIGYPFAWGLRNIILLVICELLCNSGKSPVHFLISP